MLGKDDCIQFSNLWSYIIINLFWALAFSLQIFSFCCFCFPGSCPWCKVFLLLEPRFSSSSDYWLPHICSHWSKFLNHRICVCRLLIHVHNMYNWIVKFNLLDAFTVKVNLKHRKAKMDMDEQNFWEIWCPESWRARLQFEGPGLLFGKVFLLFSW